MLFAELLTRWTIRLALVCYVATLAMWLGTSGENPWRSSVARILWTAGCLLFLGHVVCAFTFYHGWSHAHVLTDTARQTKEMMGWEFGEGIYFSYLFTLLWTADVLWWWMSPATYLARPRAVTWSLHAFMAFIAFNGAVVFVSGPTRWCAIAACVGLGVLGAARVVGRRSQARWPHPTTPEP
jgi:hypothetical protein